jgi:hypothetical protein
MECDEPVSPPSQRSGASDASTGVGTPRVSIFYDNDSDDDLSDDDDEGVETLARLRGNVLRYCGPPSNLRNILREEHLERYLVEFEHQWLEFPDDGDIGAHLITRARKQFLAIFGEGGKEMDMTQAYNATLHRVVQLYNAYHNFGFLGNVNPAVIMSRDGTDSVQLGTQAVQHDTIARFGKLLNVMKMCYVAVMSTERALSAMRGEAELDMGENDSALITFCMPVADDPTQVESLYAFMMEAAHMSGLRRRGDAIYAQFMLQGKDRKSGKCIHTPTHAWFRMGTILEWMYKRVDRYTHYEQWRNMMRGNTATSVAEHLERAHDPCLPDLEKDRNCFSFRNGVYDASELKFYPYNPREGEEGVPSDVTSCSFHDMSFRHRHFKKVMAKPGGWRNIKVAALDRILKYQGLDDATIECVYALLGRYFFSTGVAEGEEDAYVPDDYPDDASDRGQEDDDAPIEVDRDNSQFMLLFQGMGGTGKSVTLEMLSSVFEVTDVSRLANRSETTFGDEGLLKDDRCPFLVIAPEMDANFNKDLTMFKSMIAAERVSVARKNKKPVELNWTAPIIGAANEFPNFDGDKGGAMSRRFVVVHFGTIVRNTDETLLERFRHRQLDAFIMKATAAWAEFREQNRGKKGNIHDQLARRTQYFRKTTQEMMLKTNMLDGFLAQEDIIRKNPNGMVGFAEFRARYNEWGSTQKGRAPELDNDFYTPVFSRHGITVTSEEAKTGVKSVWIKGIEFVSNELDRPTQPQRYT